MGEKPKILLWVANVTAIRIQRISGPDTVFWIPLIQVELEAHRRNRTWELVHKPADKRRVNCKRVFRIQKKLGGSLVSRQDLSLEVICKYSRRISVDDIFAGVSRNKMRVMLAWAVGKKWEINQFNVKTPVWRVDRSGSSEEVFLRAETGSNDMIFINGKVSSFIGFRDKSGGRLVVYVL